MPKPIVIDLSHHNVIPRDLNNARASGIAGVIHKATDGLSFVDEKFNSRYSLARDANMLFGAYHFLRPGMPGMIDKQADRFLQIVEGCCPLDKTLLVCDFETTGIPLDDVLEFLELVAKQSNQQPVLYAGNVLKELGAAAKCPRLGDYRLWLAQYGPKPVLPKGYKSLWLWQYSESGTVPGIDGNVDLNAFNGTEADLKANWVVPVSAAASMPEQNASEEQGGSAKAHISASDQASSLDSSTQPPSKPPPDPQVLVKEKASAWSKVWAGICYFFGTVWATVTGWYATDFAKPLMDKARDNAINNFSINLVPQIALLFGVVIGIGIITVAFLWLGVWVWNHEKNRVARLNEMKMDIAAQPKLATVDFTSDPSKATAMRQTGENVS
jgi:lysozyme